MNWNSYFEMMKDWKQLPAYKAEPRIDSLVGHYLPDILSQFCNERMVGIVPEFPIRLASIDKKHEGTNYANRSYKVDFYLLSATGTNYFVEFKTDSGSRRYKQDLYLNATKSKGMKVIVEGAKKIASVSSYKKKYNHLFSKLIILGLLNNEGEYAGVSDRIKIIYVQPNEKENNSEAIVTFDWIAKWLNTKYTYDEFENALAGALSHWSND